MLSLDIEEFLLQVKDGSFENVGPPNKSATVKMFDVEDARAREFGDKRVKLVFEDDEGNELQVALFPEDVLAVADDIEALQEGQVFE